MKNGDLEDMLVSFIVPVYNVESYIKKCVESICCQVYQNLEIILIDDGSEDDSGNIIDVIARKDKRIQVIHKKNEGVSIARNEGLKRAQGEIVLFVDGDDYIEPDYAEYMVNLAVEYQCDMVVVKNQYDVNHTQQISTDYPEVVNPEKVMEDIYLGKIFMAVWNKAYRREFLIKNKILFNPDLWYGEGMLFNIICLQCTDKVVLGQRRIYNYVYNPLSAMRNFKIENERCGIKSLELQKKAWKKVNCHIEWAWRYHYRGVYFSILKGLLKTNQVDLHREEYIDCIKKCRKNLWISLLVKIPIKQKIFGIVMGIMPVSCAKLLIMHEKKLFQKIEHTKEYI